MARILLLISLEFCLVPVLVMAGFTQERRPGFWRRIVLGSLAVPPFVFGVALVAPARVTVALFGAIVIGGLVVVPVLWSRNPASPPGPSDEDGGGGGAGPELPAPPEPPRGGIPLPDADPWPDRVRDHARPRTRTVERPRSRERELRPRRRVLR